MKSHNEEMNSSDTSKLACTSIFLVLLGHILLAGLVLHIGSDITHVARLQDDLCGGWSHVLEEGEEASFLPTHLMPSHSEALTSYRSPLCL